MGLSSGESESLEQGMKKVGGSARPAEKTIERAASGSLSPWF
jgi:hypothetical protein